MSSLGFTPRDPAESGVVEAAPAATVALLRDGEAGLEVLLTKRSSRLAFHGGAWVFPGGRIDAEDYDGHPEDLDAAARRAAVREAKEEAGLDVDVEALVHLSNWTTPEISPKRFATWFFVGSGRRRHARSPTGPRPTSCSGSGPTRRSRRARRARSSSRRRST